MSGGKYTFEGGFWFGETIPFSADFIIKNKTRISRTVFRYECWVSLTNLSQYAVENVKLELVDVPDNMSIVDPCVSYSYIEAGKTATSEDTCIIDVNRTVPINSSEIVWEITYEIAGTGQAGHAAEVLLNSKKSIPEFWRKKLQVIPKPSGVG